jgi:hypothetical protein
VVLIEFTAQGTLESYDLSRRTALATALAAAAAVSPTDVALTLVAASVRVLATISVPSSSASGAVAATLRAALPTAASASVRLGVDVVGAPNVSETTHDAAAHVVHAATSSAESVTYDGSLAQRGDTRSGDGAMRPILAAVFGVLGMGLLIVIARRWRQRRLVRAALPAEQTKLGTSSHLEVEARSTVHKV